MNLIFYLVIQQIFIKIVLTYTKIIVIFNATNKTNKITINKILEKINTLNSNKNMLN